jgi:anti-sigma regulatory factor (Ser/Thr protein kinase)
VDERIDHPAVTGAGVLELRSPARLATVRSRMRSAGRDAGFPDDRLFGLVAAASEAAMNALVHGGGRAAMRVGVGPDCGSLQVWVADRGSGIPVEELPRAALLPGHSGVGTLGQGFQFLLCGCDRLHLLTGPAGTRWSSNCWRARPTARAPPPCGVHRRRGAL